MRFVSNVTGSFGCTNVRLVMNGEENGKDIYQIHFDVQDTSNRGGMIEGTREEIVKLASLLKKFQPSSNFLSCETPFKDEM